MAHPTIIPKKWLILQTTSLLSMSVVWGLFGGLCSGMAALVGAASYVLPQWLFAVVLFRKVGAKHARNVVKAFYLAELLKFIFSTLLLIWALVVLMQPLPLLVTFVVGVFSHLLSIFLV